MNFEPIYDNNKDYSDYYGLDYDETITELLTETLYMVADVEELKRRKKSNPKDINELEHLIENNILFIECVKIIEKSAKQYKKRKNK